MRTEPPADPSAYPTAQTVRAAMPADRRTRSTQLGVAIFFANALLYIATFAGVLLIDGWGWKWLFALANGAVVSILFIIGHDANHGALTASPRVNRLIGRLAFLPALQPPSTWILTHNRLHHAWTNLKGYDPVYTPFSKKEYDALPQWRRWLERVYRTVPGLGLMYFIEVYWKRELFPQPGHRPRNRRAFEFDRAMMIGFLLLEVVTGFAVPYGLGAPATAAAATAGLTVIVPFAIWNWISAFVTFQHHTHPRVAWFDQREEWAFYHGQVRGTTHVVFPLGANLALHRIMEHTAHHVDPLIPLYRLRASQDRLEEQHVPDVIVVQWTVREFLRTVAACKLYDYRAHRWMRFNGTYTSARTLPET